MSERMMVDAMDKREKQKALAKVHPRWAYANEQAGKESGGAADYWAGKAIGVIEALADILEIEWIEADVALRNYQPKE